MRNDETIVIPSVSSHPTPRYSTRLSRPDYARIDQLIDLAADDRVLHMILKGSRVTLGLLQNRLHDWISHNLLRR
jgi:hypothetical protein